MPRPPRLEGSRLAWSLTILTAAVLGALVLAETLPPWVAAVIHVVVLSLVTYGLFAWDKRRARLDKRRVSEANLLWLCVLGGSVGAWFAMGRLRHKTKHMRFRLLAPAALLAHLAAIIWLAAQA